MKKPKPTEVYSVPSSNNGVRSHNFFLTLKRIGSAYVIVLKKILLLILFIGIIAASGFIISYPLWLFATTNQKGYSITALCIFAGGVIAFTIIRINRNRKITHPGPGTYRKRILRFLFSTCSIIALLAALFVLVFLFTRGLYLYGTLLLILFLFFLGLFLYDITKVKS